MAKIWVLTIFLLGWPVITPASSITMTCKAGLKVFTDAYVRFYEAKATTSTASSAYAMACDLALKKCLRNPWYLGRKGFCEIIN